MSSFTPRKPCVHPGCPALIEIGARCDEHKKQASSGYNKARGSACSLGYDRAWEAIRLKALKRDNYICQDCLEKGFVQPAKHVDHVIPFRGKKDPNRLLLSNLRSLCMPCHSRKSVLYDGGLGRKRRPM